MPLTEEGKMRRFANYEKIGLDRIKHDLLNGGHRLVGGTPEVKEAAWEWVRLKEAAMDKNDVVTLKPGIWGVSIDLRALWKALQAKFFGRHD